jgi:FkbM family methyltransferase
MRLIHLARLGRVLPTSIRRRLLDPWERMLLCERSIREQKLYAPFVKPGDLVFDIGANDGTKCDAFLRLGARVIAVEPDPRCAMTISRRFAREIDQGRLTVLPVAIGRTAGTARLTQFSFGGPNASASDVFSSTVKEQMGPVTTIDVKVIAGASLFDRYGDVSFIKIDVEGMDAEVLSTVARRPRSLSFEFNLSKALLPITKACLLETQRLGFIEANFTRATDTRLCLRSWVRIDRALDQLLRAADGRGLWGDVIVR